MKFLSREPRFESRAPALAAQNLFCVRPSTFGPRLFSCRAFTLIEIMIALVIFTMLVAAVYSTWVLLLKSSQIAQAAAAQVQRERITIRTLEDSLTCIQSFQASMKYYAFGVTNGEKPTLSFVARVPDVFPRNGRFGDFNLRRLTFTLEPAADSAGGPSAENDLVLRQNPMLMDMDADEQATPLVLARNVKKFIIECWDTNKLDWADEWNDTNSIPPMMRIKLSLGSNASDAGAAATLDITREIAVPSGTLPRVAQTGSPFNGAGPGGMGSGGVPGNQNNSINSAPPNVPIQPRRPQINSGPAYGPGNKPPSLPPVRENP
jgi:prepilin-type N-terminal cleavage/methylation domain-containing protein